MIVTKAPPVTVPCWNCGHPSSPLLLPDVRRMRCPVPSCRAELPAISQIDYVSERISNKLPIRDRDFISKP